MVERGPHKPEGVGSTPTVSHDFGFAILDFGLKGETLGLQSKINNPKSKIVLAPVIQWIGRPAFNRRTWVQFPPGAVK